MPTILCFGDSNTYGTAPMAHLADARRLGRGERWPTLMAAQLGAGYEVIEAGHPGRTTLHDDPMEGANRNGLRHLPVLLESHRPLDLVIVKLGTNDLKTRFSVTAFDIARSIERLLLEIEGAQSGPDFGVPKLLVVAPPPILETGCLEGMFEGGAAKSRQFAALMGAVAAEHGAAFLDAGAHIAVSPVDGIHYDAKAHADLAGILARTVSGLFAAA